ncbi:gsr3865 [Gloeobacter violaceus PCC 7421]|uniref:Gsr3865 protein n=1 Tax=Gloeobacter violaceus (strain ATCC 29082 / PCC 7421) TaxID=251221 RepID=Q7NEL4_GLOVI|nr:gsr3865 [Gloeobacter violaceus PCC 7421]
MPAMSALRCNGVLERVWKRLLERGKSKMAALVAVMRKMVHSMYGVLNSQRPFDPNYGSSTA